MATKDLRTIKPALFARLDTQMWQAYYKHNFFKLFLLLIRLCYSYFSPNPILILRTAYHSAMAAIVFRKTKGNEDLDTVMKHLQKFYKLVSAHNIQAFDYSRAAELELDGWLVDRYPKRYKISRATALSAGAAAIYNVKPASLKTYGQKREAAMLLLGSHHDDATAVHDWAKIESLLNEAYEGLAEAVAA